jgi:hypothetical protein
MTDTYWNSVFASRQRVIFQSKYENNLVDDGKTKTEFQIINLHIHGYSYIIIFIKTFDSY